MWSIKPTLWPLCRQNYRRSKFGHQSRLYDRSKSRTIDVQNVANKAGSTIALTAELSMSKCCQQSRLYDRSNGRTINFQTLVTKAGSMIALTAELTMFKMWSTRPTLWSLCRQNCRRSKCGHQNWIYDRSNGRTIYVENMFNKADSMIALQAELSTFKVWSPKLALRSFCRQNYRCSKCSQQSRLYDRSSGRTINVQNLVIKAGFTIALSSELSMFRILSAMPALQPLYR